MSVSGPNPIQTQNFNRFEVEPASPVPVNSIFARINRVWARRIIGGTVGAFIGIGFGFVISKLAEPSMCSPTTTLVCTLVQEGICGLVGEIGGVVIAEVAIK